MIKQKLKVWDLPTRLFHWCLLPAMIFMWYSAEQGGNWLVWHLRCGVFILALLVFRICWGFWGSDTAQFRQFFKPTLIGRYIKGGLSENEQPGHNPLGALMVLVLIGALLLQVTTGLFAADENTFLNSGYLNSLVSSEVGSNIRGIHIAFFNLLVILIAVHVGTVLFYKFVKKHDLIKPMITGYKELSGQLPNLSFAGTKALAAAIVVALVVVIVVLSLG